MARKPADNIGRGAFGVTDEVGSGRVSLRARLRLGNVFIVLAAIVSAILAASACGDADAPTSSASQRLEGVTTAGVGDAPDDDAGSDVDAVGATSPTRGARRGTLRVLLPCTRSVDPVGGDCHAVFDEIFAGLTAITGDPDEPVVPDLAESFSVSEGGLRYTFVLRRELAFSDGSPLTASDFKWSWERALRLSRVDEDAELVVALLPIAGAEAVRSGDADELAGVTVADERTLVVRLAAPRPDFLFLMADHAATPLSESNVKVWQDDLSLGDADDIPPVGTGPFRIAEFGVRGEPGLTLARNDHYHGESALPDAIEMIPLQVFNANPEEFDLPAAMFDLYERGDIDIVPFAPEGARSADGGTYEREHPAEVGYLVLNPDVEPTDDLRIRRALVHAADVTGVVDHAAAYGVMWDGIPGFNPELAFDRFDPDAALDEFEGSSYNRRDVSATLDWCYPGPASGGLSIGRNVEELAAGWSHALRIDAHERPAIDGDCAHETPLIAVQVAPPYPSALPLYEPLRAQFAERTSETARELVRLLDAAASEPDTVARYARYGDVEAYLHEQALVLPIVWHRFVSTEFVRDTVGGYDPQPYGGSIYRGVWVRTSAE